MNSQTLLQLIATKDPTSIKCCCNKYDNSVINNHFSHIITGNLNIANNQSLRQLISKGPKYQEPKQICFKEARKEIQTSTDQFMEKISSDKGIHKNHFQNGKVILHPGRECRAIARAHTPYFVQVCDHRTPKFCIKHIQACDDRTPGTAKR